LARWLRYFDASVKEYPGFPSNEIKYLPGCWQKSVLQNKIERSTNPIFFLFCIKDDMKDIKFEGIIIYRINNL
jgi:hypothetical protein